MAHNSFFGDRSNEEPKLMGLNFIGAKWMNFFTGTKTQIRQFY
jgi:hypothetical protein